MADDDGGFLSRWSRRKAALREGQALPGGPASVAPAALAPVPVPPQTIDADANGQSAQPAEPGAAPAPLTLADVTQLTAESDYAPFAARHVDPQVRNAAMKKLFHSDPHFNVMDGLDIYIGDYNTPDPLPKSMLRQMVQARFLGLLDDEMTEQDKPTPDPALPAAPVAEPPIAHEDADLQLQPDDAAGREGAGPGPGDVGPAAG